MNLNALTLTDLADLATKLTDLHDVGSQLAALGMEPAFDLRPGQAAAIRLPVVMPPMNEAVISGPLSVELAPLIKRAVQSLAERCEISSTEAASAPTDAEAVPFQPVPVEAPSAVSLLPAGGAPISAEQSIPQGAAESDGGQAVAAADTPPVAPVPGSASALAASWQAPMWTAEEDDRLVSLVVASVMAGASRNQAATSAAGVLGRPVEGVKFRCKTKLKARIDAAVEARSETPSPTGPATAQEDAESGPAGDAAAVESIPAAVQPDDIAAHLAGLTDKGGWSLQRDLDLMELSIAGWKTNKIALEIQMQHGAIRPRFDTLTGLYTDEATGKKARRFTREAVLGALLAMAGRAA